MVHDNHASLLRYDPRQILVDGCRECEQRAQEVDVAISLLDTERFAQAWRRAYDFEAANGNWQAVGPVSNTERRLLGVLWVVQLQLQRAGGRLDGTVPIIPSEAMA